MLLTVTRSQQTRGSLDEAKKMNSWLTAIGARLRRAGAQVRVTAREEGEQNARPHNHIVIALSLDDCWSFAVGHWRGFAQYAEEWQPDAGARKALQLHARWVCHGCRGERPFSARTRRELILGRYLAENQLGFVDVLEVDGPDAVAYCLQYASKGGGRVSYSRAASVPWAHGAHLQVYAHGGKMCYYPPRDRTWARTEIRRLDRLDARKRHSHEELKRQALIAFKEIPSTSQGSWPMKVMNHHCPRNSAAPSAKRIRRTQEWARTPDAQLQRVFLVRCDSSGFLIEEIVSTHLDRVQSKCSILLCVSTFEQRLIGWIQQKIDELNQRQEPIFCKDCIEIADEYKLHEVSRLLSWCADHPLSKTMQAVDARYWGILCRMPWYLWIAYLIDATARARMCDGARRLLVRDLAKDPAAAVDPDDALDVLMHGV